MVYKKLIMVLFSLVILFLFVSCDFLTPSGTDPVTISQRLELFENGLNAADRTNLYKNFHSLMENYNQIKDPVFFDDTQFSYAYEPFTIVVDGTPTDNGLGQMDVNVTMTNDNGSFTMQLVMDENETDVYYIRTLSMTVGDLLFEIKKIPLN